MSTYFGNPFSFTLYDLKMKFYPVYNNTMCAVMHLVIQFCPTLCDHMDCSPTRLFCSWGFSRQEHWSGWPSPPSGDLPGTEPRSPTLQADSLPTEPPGKPKTMCIICKIFIKKKSTPSITVTNT